MVRMGDGDWIYVTEYKSPWDFDLRPVLFDTEDEADSFASAWRLKGKETNAKVVKYEN